MKPLTIIIPLYKAEQYLDGLFSSIQSCYPAAPWLTVIGVNDHSPDASAQRIQEKYPWVHVITPPENLGFARAVNFGVQYALEKYNPEYLFILNQDTEISPGIFESLLTEMDRDPSIGIAHPLVMRYPKSDGLVNSSGNNISFLGYGYITYDGIPRIALPPEQLRVHDVGYMAGMGFVIKTLVLKETRNKKQETSRLYALYDPDYINYHEDTDLALRVKLAGYRIVCVPEAILEHKYISHTKTKFAQSRNVYYWIERNRFILFAKFYTTRMLLLFLPALIVNEIGVMGYSFVQGFWKERLRVYGWVLTHIGFLMKKRKEMVFSREGEKILLQTLVAEVQYTEIQNPLLTFANWMWRMYFQWVKKLMK